MKKYLLLIIVCLFSCSGKQEAEEVIAPFPADTVPQSGPKVNLVIVPGNSIGNVSLGQNSQELDFLGQADLSDAAMGKAWLTWYSANSKRVNGKSELNIYTTYKDNEMKEKVVRQIRITSPDFKTADGIRAGMAFSEIQKLMPNLDYIGSFRNPGTGNPVELYDATPTGIAFEIENTGSEKNCIAIIIHPKDRNVTEEYQYFHPDLIRG